MKDSLIIQVEEILPQPNKISIHTPMGSIETGDDSPVMDVLVIFLIFGAFCIYVYAKFFKKNHE